MQFKDKVVEMVCHLTLRTLPNHQGIIKELYNGGRKEWASVEEMLRGKNTRKVTANLYS